MITVWPAAFKYGFVVIDFRDYTGKELDRLRALVKLTCPGCEVPAYAFGSYYKCSYVGRWSCSESPYLYHPLRSPMVRRIGDIFMPEIDEEGVVK